MPAWYDFPCQQDGHPIIILPPLTCSLLVYIIVLVAAPPTAVPSIW